VLQAARESSYGTDSIARLYDSLNNSWRQVWDPQQLRQEFEVLDFVAPYVVVRRRSDGALGSFEFQHDPRLYFNFEADQNNPQS
jgi:hypothetical protein